MSSLGFTGTATGMTGSQWDTVRELVELMRPTHVHHGDCVGADAEFHDIARHIASVVHVHPPEEPWKRAWKMGYMHPERPYLDRNQDIVDASDLLLATPGTAEERLRSGTWATIRRARKRGIPILIVQPSGEIQRENLT